jgi:hypothetical protein
MRRMQKVLVVHIIRMNTIDPSPGSKSSVRATKVGIGHVSTVQREDALCFVRMKPCQSRHGGWWPVSRGREQLTAVDAEAKLVSTH